MRQLVKKYPEQNKIFTMGKVMMMMMMMMLMVVVVHNNFHLLRCFYLINSKLLPADSVV